MENTVFPASRTIIFLQNTHIDRTILATAEHAKRVSKCPNPWATEDFFATIDRGGKYDSYCCPFSKHTMAARSSSVEPRSESKAIDPLQSCDTSWPQRQKTRNRTRRLDDAMRESLLARINPFLSVTSTPLMFTCDDFGIGLTRKRQEKRDRAVRESMLMMITRTFSAEMHWLFQPCYCSLASTS